MTDRLKYYRWTESMSEPEWLEECGYLVMAHLRRQLLADDPGLADAGREAELREAIDTNFEDMREYFRAYTQVVGD
jgi:hypothetical protein